MKMVRGLALILGTAAAALAFTAGPATAGGHGDRYDNGRGHGHGHGNWYDDNGHGGQSSHGNVGLLNGNQAYIPVHIPINVCGNSIALLGLANSNAGCVNN
jgi:hypothetical protein